MIEGPHLPPPQALAHRSGQVPAQGGGRYQLKRDPLLVLAERLRDRGVDKPAIDQLDSRVGDQVAAAVEAAKAAPRRRRKATAFTDLWADRCVADLITYREADGGPGWRI